MAKTTVSSLISEIKRAIDYDITDADLDTLLIDFINDGLRTLYNLFRDYRIWAEITDRSSFSTVANQEYVDVTATITDLDEIIRLSERDNDSVIDLINWSDYVQLLPDPTANSSSSPRKASRFETYIYFYPRPNAVITIYIDYVKQLTKVTSSSTLPFTNKYDALLKAMIREDFQMWLDSSNAVAIAAAKKRVDELKDEYIITASKNLGEINQSASRRGLEEYFAPRIPV